MLEHRYKSRHDAVQDILISHIKENDFLNKFIIQQNPILNVCPGKPNKPDFIVEAKDKSVLYVLDPTVRTEYNIKDMEEQRNEKYAKYSYLIEHYKQEGFKQVFVHGLWFGARGGVDVETVQFLKKEFLVTERLIERIIVEVLQHSAAMIFDVLRKK